MQNKQNKSKNKKKKKSKNKPTPNFSVFFLPELLIYSMVPRMIIIPFNLFIELNNITQKRQYI